MVAYIILLFIGFLFAAFFAGTETAFIVYTGSKQKHIRSHFVSFFVEEPERFLTLLLVGTNISIVTASASATRILTKIAPTRGEIISLVAVSVLSLIFCEILPKQVAIVKSSLIVNRTSIILYIIYYLLYPFIRIVLIFSGIFISVARKCFKKPVHKFMKDELILFLEKKKTSFSYGKIKFIKSAFFVEEKRVKDYARRAENLQCIKFSGSVGDVLELARRTGLTVFPVADDIGNIMGSVELISVIGEDPFERVERFVKPLCLLNENLTIKEILPRLAQLTPICALVDENNKLSSIFIFDDFADTLEEVLMISAPE